jgi:hypothetical protein
MNNSVLKSELLQRTLESFWSDWWIFPRNFMISFFLSVLFSINFSKVFSQFFTCLSVTCNCLDTSIVKLFILALVCSHD